MGRFINADAFTSTGQGLTGNNMFAYCGNNPVMNADYTGELCGLIVAGIAIVGTLLAIPSSENQVPYHECAATEKYNASTVHVYYEGIGEPAEGKFNVRFYTANAEKGYVNIYIEDSLKIQSEYETEAILDVVMSSEYYSYKAFGNRDYMRAQWIAHNMSYDLASSSWIGFKAMSYLGNSQDPVESSTALDIRCKKILAK